MTRHTTYTDDVTDEEYDDGSQITQFALVAGDSTVGVIDVHATTLLDDVDAVADELHDMVDDWAQAQREHLAVEQAAGRLQDGDGDGG